MSSVNEHYAKHLGPIYTWMAGGVEDALERGGAELDALLVSAVSDGLAVDLGSGFGMHAIPLARRGFSVLAIDTCAALLEELRRQRGDLPIQTVEDDLLAFPAHLTVEPKLVLCMGDTLTHLPEVGAVSRLISLVSEVLQVGGRFVVTFRDYTHELSGVQRFIPARSDENRILTCFLEYAVSHVTVHDILHERDASGWHLRVGSYRKLRLGPEWVCTALESSGFEVRREPGMAGMVRLVATRV